MGRGRLVLSLVTCFLGSRQFLVIALQCVGRGRLVLSLVTCFLGSRQLLVIALHCVGRGRLLLRLIACFLGSRQVLVIVLQLMGGVSWLSGWLRIFQFLLGVLFIQSPGAKFVLVLIEP